MYRANLILHTGAHTVERERLPLVATPERTESWVPIPHLRLLEQVEDVLSESGYAVVGQAHALARDGARYFGLLQVANGQDADNFGLVVGVRNSHDKSFPAGLVLGASVFVCDNLSFSGEVKLARKHTANIERDLPALVLRAVGRLVDLRTRQEQRYLAYQGAEVSDRQAHDLVIRALDAGIVPVTRIPALLEQWREPNHPEFAHDGKTAWRLFNGFTEVLKGNLTELPRRTQALHGLLDAELGLVLPPRLEVSADATIEAVAQAV